MAAALNQAVAEPEEIGDASLSVRAVRNGELTDVLVVVDNAAGERVAAGRTYTSDGTNPRILPLAAGKYTVTVTAVALRGATVQTFKNVEIPAGETVERSVDFSSRQLSVLVTRNGELSDATVNVFQAGTKTHVTGGRTYTADSSNPRVFEITPGHYDVEIASVAIVDRDNRNHRFENVEVKPQESSDREHNFRSGVLPVGAVVGNELVDAVVQVIPNGTTRPTTASRTYTSESSNPRAFILTPGRYTVTVAPVRLPGKPKREFGIEVLAEETAEQIIDFAP